MAFVEKSNTHFFNNFIPSLIFFDIDGTLLDSQGRYSQELKQELNRLSGCGVKLAIASGRPSIAAQFLFDELPLTDAGMFCTGAEIYNPQKSDHIETHYLCADDVRLLFDQVQEQQLYCEFYTTKFYTAGHDLDIADVHSRHLRVTPRVLSPHELLESRIPMTKLLLGANKKTHNGALERMSRNFPQFEFAFAHFLARPDWVFASVVSSSANKISGFESLLDYHNVRADQVMAFGDSHSDMVFLEQAGLGVAMGNASDQVKAIADSVALCADDNGVADCLGKILM